MSEARRFGSRQCETSREWTSLRLDGELSELEEAMLRRHVAGCADCEAYVAAAEAFTTRLRSAPLESPPPMFEATAERASRSRFLRVGAAAAAVAASAAVMFAPGLGSGPTSGELAELGAGTADVTLDAMRAGQRARARLPESIQFNRVRVIELT